MSEIDKRGVFFEASHNSLDWAGALADYFNVPQDERKYIGDGGMVKHYTGFEKPQKASVSASFTWQVEELEYRLWITKQKNRWIVNIESGNGAFKKTIENIDQIFVGANSVNFLDGTRSVISIENVLPRYF